MSRLIAFKDAVRQRGGSIDNTGYITHGDQQVALVEAHGLSHQACQTIEQELHFVTFDGHRGGGVEFTVDMSVERGQ